ncbi:MAG: hypothetical protein ABI723_16050 [Bacteroidia bacterium]
MKSKSLLTLVAVLFMSVITVHAQSVDDIINKNIHAIGGIDKIKSTKTMKVYINFEQQGVKYPVTMTFKKPGMIYTEVEVQGMKIQSGFDGKQGWAINPMSGKTEAEPMTEEQIKDMKDQADFDGKLVDYAKKGYKAELIGKDELEGTAVYKVKLTKGDDITTYFIDAASYLVLKERTKHVIKGKEMESDALYSDYKSVDGLMYPFSIEQREVDAEEGMKMTVDKVELNVKVDDALFAMPKMSDAAPKPSTPVTDTDDKK